MTFKEIKDAKEAEKASIISEIRLWIYGNSKMLKKIFIQ